MGLYELVNQVDLDPELRKAILNFAAEREWEREKFQTIYDSAPVALIVLNQQQKIINANVTAQTLLQYSAKQLIKQTFHDLFADSIYLEIQSSLAHLVDGIAPSGIETIALKKSGDHFDVNINFSQIHTQDGLYILCSLLDISQRKKAEHKLEKKALQLEESNEELKRFAFVASHDLREPLRKLKVFSSLLLSECAEPLGAEGKDYLLRIEKSAQRMDNLVENLLSYARHSSLMPTMQQVDLNDVMALVTGEMNELIQATNAQIAYSKLPKTFGDPIQLQQLFSNLINNSIKYRRQDSNPQIEISYKTALARNVNDKDFLQIYIKDNGIGFPMDMKDSIFQIFKRLHSRDEIEGCGIGLSICKRIVINHGGEISATSDNKLGAEFRIALPIYNTR